VSVRVCVRAFVRPTFLKQFFFHLPFPFPFSFFVPFSCPFPFSFPLVLSLFLSFFPFPILLLYNLKLNCLIFFSTGLNGSLIIFIRTYTLNYQNALDRLRIRMNIILLRKKRQVMLTALLPRLLVYPCSKNTMVYHRKSTMVF